MREEVLLAQLREVFDRHSRKPDLVVDNGDDGAIFAPQGKEVVIAADVAVEGVHFKREWSSSFDIARKITAANLADICAMGGWPQYLLVTAVIPSGWLEESIEIAQGIVHEANLVDAAVIGGDLSTGHELSLSITAVGYVEKKLLRSGARPGQYVVVSHRPGWSAAGLDLLRRGEKSDSPQKLRAISAHMIPEIPYDHYRSAFPYLSSATDTSDSLLIDLGHIAQSSKVSIDIDYSSLVDPELEVLGDCRDWILNGGEDHVLVGTTDHPEKCPKFIVIGKVKEGSGEIFLDGTLVERSGFQHEWKS